jgi:hypothetical protein
MLARCPGLLDEGRKRHARQDLNKRADIVDKCIEDKMRAAKAAL